jgi:hypothetical protein
MVAGLADLSVMRCRKPLTDSSFFFDRFFQHLRETFYSLLKISEENWTSCNGMQK